MTVLWETGDCPPRKRLCLSTSQTRRSIAPSSQDVHATPHQTESQRMAMPVEPGSFFTSYAIQHTQIVPNHKFIKTRFSERKMFWLYEYTIFSESQISIYVSIFVTVNLYRHFIFVSYFGCLYFQSIIIFMLHSISVHFFVSFAKFWEPILRLKFVVEKSQFNMKIPILLFIF